MLTREQLVDQAQRLRSVLRRGCGLPAARTLALAVQSVTHRRLHAQGQCESGCIAPVVTNKEEPPLCAECARRMLPC